MLPETLADTFLSKLSYTNMQRIILQSRLTVIPPIMIEDYSNATMAYRIAKPEEFADPVIAISSKGTKVWFYKNKPEDEKIRAMVQHDEGYNITASGVLRITRNLESIAGTCSLIGLADPERFIFVQYSGKMQAKIWSECLQLAINHAIDN